ncbi:hypothetical protein LJC64_05065 [Ruminococcaceae bacterium OttesenSCG-928-A11]|nr:hypothetical protein [Ruminococcaceae bacterium OttesenSCG-928-A11]
MDEKSIGTTALCLSGGDWQLCKGGADSLAAVARGEGAFIPAAVPGNVQTDLENARELLPLWYGMGDSNLLDVCLSGWWYRKCFTPPAGAAGRHTLVFDGVDYACDIYLNGALVGSHEGMFLRFAVDVTGQLRPGAENVLCVYLHPMPEELVPWLVNSDGPMSGEGTDYFFVEANTRIRQVLKGLKSPSVCSYDWGTNIYTLGIWKDVTLESTGAVRAEWLQVKTALAGDYTSAAVEPVLELDSTAEATVEVEYRLSGPGCEMAARQTAAVPAGSSKLAHTLTIENPALWWPVGHGEQPLYTLLVTGRDGRGAVTFEKSERFGLREIRWELTDGAPADFPNKFALVINGRRVRTMGSNIVTPDLLPARAAKNGAHYIEMAKACGMNTLRQHGGQPVLPQSTYDAADELGIMLLVDFPIANCVPENEPVFLKNFADTVSNITKQLRNHPSIIEWSGGNELNWYFDPTADHTALEVQRAAVAAEDDRTFRPTCPIYGSRHAPWVYNPELHYKEFNRDIKDNFGEIPMMRYGEFGCQTPANLEAWMRDIPSASRWPVKVDDPVLVRKNAVQAVFSPNAWLMLPTIEQFFGPMDGIADAVKAGQFLGAEGLRYMMDALRAMGGRLGGFTSWDYNEPWPNGAGSYVVDYDGAPVMAYHFAKQAMEPLSLQLKYDSIKFNFIGETKVGLRLVSDAAAPAEGLRWQAVMRDRHGKAYNKMEGRAGIRPLEVQWLADLDITPPEAVVMGPVFCELTLRDNAGALISERLHLFVPEGVEHPMRGLLYEVGDRPFGIPYATTGMVPGRVAQTEISLENAAWKRDDEWEQVTLTVKNTGEMTALFLHPEPLTRHSPHLFIEGDHLSVPPGESRQVTMRSHPGPVPLSAIGFTLAGWNTNTLTLAPDASVAFWFGTRNGTCREYAAGAVQGDTFTAENRTINPAGLHHRQTGEVRFTFKSENAQSGPARLRLALADSAPGGGTLKVGLNGHTLEAAIPPGYGIQAEDPEHYAQPAELVLDFPAGALAAGENSLCVTVEDGWFTWDALMLLAAQ